MKSRALKIIIWSLVILALIAGVGYVVKKHGHNRCHSVDISISGGGESNFVTREDIRNYILTTGDSLTGENLTGIDVEAIESLINANPYVLNSKVYLTLDGILRIEVQQRTPVARVQNIYNQKYYLSRDGRMMPWVPGKYSRVMFANGNIREMYWKDRNLNAVQPDGRVDSVLTASVLYQIYKIACQIDSDPFLKAQMQQLYVSPQGEISLWPVVGKHVIIFGNSDSMDEKFNKLKVFYKKAGFFQGWDKYDTINLKYQGQVICS